MDMAQVVSQRSTCSRLHVGAIVSRDGRVIATGYNGAPSGLPHCIHEEWEYTGQPDTDWPQWVFNLYIGTPFPAAPPVRGTKFYHHNDGVTWTTGRDEAPGCTNVEHAERNAIAFAARYGSALDGAELDCTHAPCLNCARAIINAGIRVVRYVHPYRKTEGVEALLSVGIDVLQVEPTDGMMRLW